MRAKKLTRRMIDYVENNMKLDASEWGYERNTSTEFVLVNLKNGTKKTVDKVEHNIILF